MTDDAALNFFCRGCGYSLQGLESTRCPECGREFDWTNPHTMSRSGHLPWHRRFRQAIWVGTALLLLGGYAWAYQKLVQIRPPQSPPIVIVPFSLNRGNSGIEIIHHYPRPVPAIGEFTYANSCLTVLFWPINVIDRRVRRNLWTFYDIGTGRYLPQDTNIAARTLAESAQLNRSDLASRQKQLFDQLCAMEQFKPGVSYWRTYKAQALATADLLRQEMQTPPAPSTAPSSR